MVEFGSSSSDVFTMTYFFIIMEVLLVVNRTLETPEHRHSSVTFCVSIVVLKPTECTEEMKSYCSYGSLR